MEGKVPSPPEESQRLETDEARAGRTTGAVRYVLAISTALAIVVFIVAYVAVT